MLNLTRRSGQSVLVDGDIELRVLCTRLHSITIEISAPAECLIVTPTSESKGWVRYEMRVSDEIRIGEQVRVMLTRLRRPQASLGFSCPREISVWRKEISRATRVRKDLGREVAASEEG